MSTQNPAWTDDHRDQTDDFIPFHRAYFPAEALSHVRQALENGKVSGDGPYTRRCEERLEQILGAVRVLLTTSCNDALEMAALLLDIEPGDEVIVPAFAPPSAANAFALRGARPIFADIHPDRLNIDECHIETLITRRTRAIVAFHYAGVACAMDRILQIAANQGIAVIEDAAHGLYGAYRGQPLGSMGRIATLSFHETKSLTCGEGGAIVLNDPSLVHRASLLRKQGTDDDSYSEGEGGGSWVELGSRHLPSDILAALLHAQLDTANDIHQRQREIWERYVERLGPWAGKHNVRLPFVPNDCDPACPLFYVQLPVEGDRDALMNHLRSHHIASLRHYRPLHLSKVGREFGGQFGACPIAEWASATLVRLPCYPGLSLEEQNRIIDAVTTFRTIGR